MRAIVDPITGEVRAVVVELVSATHPEEALQPRVQEIPPDNVPTAPNTVALRRPGIVDRAPQVSESVAASPPAGPSVVAAKTREEVLQDLVKELQHTHMARQEASRAEEGGFREKIRGILRSSGR